MHFPLLFIVIAPLLVGQAVGIPRPRDGSLQDPPAAQAAPPAHQGAWNALTAVLGGGGLVAGARSWYLHEQLKRQTQAKLDQHDSSLSRLHNDMHRLDSQARTDAQAAQRDLQKSMDQRMQGLHQRINSLESTRDDNRFAVGDDLHTAQRELGTRLEELKHSMGQGVHDLPQRIDGLASISDGGPRPPTSGAKPAIDVPQFFDEHKAMARVLHENPDIWSCAANWLEQRNAIRWFPDAMVQVRDWIDAVDACDSSRRFPQLRPTQTMSGWYVSLPARLPTPRRNPNLLSSLAQLPARLHTAAHRSMKTLANPRIGAKLWQTGKNLEREEVQAVRLGA
ncbi:MAG: hypothetical protein M1826_000897 [Phylliscum demangeonii]|nr:MAG: hypothetical protein M1826_000897 [Phylliscum demangeonii]